MYFQYFLVASLIIWSCNDTSVVSTEGKNSSIIHLPDNLAEHFNVMDQMGFQSFEIIPLEFREESLLRGSGFQKILYQNGCFILLERINEPVFVFDTAGQFVSKIEVTGKGPGELASVSDISVSNKPTFLHVLDYMQQQVKVFELSDRNKNLRVVPLHDIKEEFGYTENFEATENGYVFYFSKSGSKSKNSVIRTTTEGSISKTIPTALFDNPMTSSFKSGQFFKIDNEIIFLKALNDTIWTWKDDNLIPKYTIPFPEELSGHKNQELPPNHFHYRSYMESDDFLYLTFMLGNRQFSYFYSKLRNQGSLNNHSEVGVRSKPGTPLSEFFHFSDSIVHGYLTQNSLDWRISNLTNLINDKGHIKIPDEAKEVLREELAKLQPAVEEGNGAIIRYRLE